MKGQNQSALFNTMKKTVLVVAAHPDDEILGVGGTILKHVEKGDAVHVLLLGDGETSRDVTADVAQREQAALEAGRRLGTFQTIFKRLPDNQFDSIPLLTIIKEISKILEEIKPEIVYTHYPFDLNVDHRLTAEAVMTACRPQPGFCVKKIWAFETLSSTEWQHRAGGTVFAPTVYVDISSVIEKKLHGLESYSQELRDYPHPRSLEGVKILSQFRGLEVGFAHAEAFQVLRELHD